MADANSSGSLLETVAETVDERTVEAFELLGNETRLSILLALWEASDPGPGPASGESALPFSELRRRVGLRHGRQFNYHLDRLVGRFVRRTEAGYELTTAGERVLSTVLAGTMTDAPSFEDEQIEAGCIRCGAPTVVDYEDAILTQRCPDCEGLVREAGEPSGVIAREYRPPVDLEDRTPREFVQQGKPWNRHRRHSFIEGTCPDCSGTVSATTHVCDHHDTGDGAVCNHCDRVHGVEACYVCDVCKSSIRTGVWNAVLTETPVVAFFYEHGLDARALEDDLAYGALFEAVARVTVRSEAPLEVVVTVELDGDRLGVTLDEETRVLDVTERSSDVG